jgi:hypothetical protein
MSTVGATGGTTIPRHHGSTASAGQSSQQLQQQAITEHQATVPVNNKSAINIKA